MTAAVVLPRRLLAAAIVVVVAWTGLVAGPARASSHDSDLYARLALPRGQIDFDLQLGTLHFFDAENSPFVVQVIDGCAINGHYWILGAGLASEAAPLTVIDGLSGQSERIVLPAFKPGEPVPTIIETEALALCRETQTGGLPSLSGVGTYTPASASCFASDDAIELLSGGSDDAYRTFVRSRFDINRVIRDKPIIATVDESPDYDELHLLREGRTPRQVEGVVFSGDPGMLPGQAALERRLKRITRSRVRRAYEAAKAGRVPRQIIKDLGLKKVTCVHHVSLDMQTLGADAFLAEAGWIADGGAPIEPPQLVEDRFEVEVVRVDGTSAPLTLSGPLVGSEQADLVWRYDGDGVLTEIVDGCSLSGSFWAIAGARTDEPLELRISDRVSGATTSQLLWTDADRPAWIADAAALDACP